ncbi:molecular chaperone HtpG [Novosphingobium sp.]|uniref:molecular chaperone HtpG n=1 Tax=Novosphingobium sp. TaxID=1874826 RepID=UPI0033410C5C
MTTTDTVAAETAAPETAPETRVFEADVARLLHLMVHAVYSDRDVFLRELIANAADACEKLRYESLANPAIASGEAGRITIALDAGAKTLTVADNGIGMTEADMIDALGTIARSGTRAFMDKLTAAKDGENPQLIGQFGVGFYSAFMVADQVEVTSRRAGTDLAHRWSSDGLGTYSIAAVDAGDAPAQGTRVVLHLKEDAAQYTERHSVERIVRAQSGHVPVPIDLIDAPGGEASAVTDGSALWTRPKADITPEEYTDFYRSVAGQFDSPALTLHYRAEGKHEYNVLAFVPETRPFDLFDPDRTGRMKLYVRRVFITDEAEIVPRYLRFVRGLIDSADLPLNMSREMIQQSPLLAAINKGVTNRILTELDKLSNTDADKYAAFWEAFGAVLKEGLYEDYARRETLLGLARFRSTSGGDAWRSLKQYVADARENQTAIYYATGTDRDRLATSPQIEGFRARGIEVLLLTDPVDSFWAAAGVDFDGKPFKSVTQGMADLGLIAPLDGETPPAEPAPEADAFLAFVREKLGDAVSDVRASDRLTTSAACLVASENGIDRQLERLLSANGQAPKGTAPVLELNLRHATVTQLSALPDDADLKADGAHLLMDEARIADGELPEDTRAFAERLTRVLAKALG